MKDRLIRCLGKQSQWIGIAVEATLSAQEGAKARHYQRDSLRVYAMMIAEAAMLSSTLKDEGDSLSLELQSFDGKEHFIAAGKPGIEVKAYSAYLDSIGVRGQGMLTLIKDLGLKEPYHSSILASLSDLPGSLDAYFLQSEQLFTKTKLLAKLDEEGNLTRVVGLMVQALPYASSSSKEEIEEAWKRIDLDAFVQKDASLEEILQAPFGEEKIQIEAKEDVLWKCGCSYEKSRKTLSLLPESEIEELIQKGEPIRIDCGFCGKEYEISVGEMKEILGQKEKKPNQA